MRSALARGLRQGLATIAFLAASSADAGGVRHLGCSADETARIEAAYAEAERHAAAGLALLAARPPHPHVRRWFGTGSRAAAIVVLKPTLLSLRPGSRPPVACGVGGGCENGETFAIALQPERRILLCPRFFAAAGGGAPWQDSLAGTLVHEVSHIAAGTEDTAYQPAAALALARRDPAAAAVNADNHQYFVETLPPGIAPDPPRPKGPIGGAPPWKPMVPGGRG